MFEDETKHIPFVEESMDVDPNYDPSDFLNMQSRNRDDNSQSAVSEAPKFDYHAINIKQEPQTHQQSYDDQDQQYDQSFDMSEMLHYQQPREPVNEPVEQPLPILAEAEPLQQPPADVAIHDDLAISDSDEDDQDFVEPKADKSADHDNEEEGDGLWF